MTMRVVARTPSVVWKELPSAPFTASAPKPPFSLKLSIVAWT